jgi:metacaspase-1
MAKRAVLVGINKYAQPGADLRGCINDVIDIKAALTELYGFADEDITTLLDRQATQAAMQAAITDLVASGEPGDVLVLHYSGHGSHVRDVNGDEDDLRDEVLCPHDMSWDVPFLDDWLRTAYDELAEGVNLTVVMDCCHSGSNNREAFPPPDARMIPRYLPNPNLMDQDGVDLDDSLAARSGSRSGGSRSTSPRRRRRGNQDVHILDLSESLITGCRDDQTSADARIDGDFHGALTYYLVAAIRELGAEASYRQIHTRTLELLHGEYEQVPQLTGREEHLDSPFLSDRVSGTVRV